MLEVGDHFRLNPEGIDWHRPLVLSGEHIYRVDAWYDHYDTVRSRHSHGSPDFAEELAGSRLYESKDLPMPVYGWEVEGVSTVQKTLPTWLISTYTLYRDKDAWLINVSDTKGFYTMLLLPTCIFANGFRWGYLGSGPKETALSILRHHFGESMRIVCGHHSASIGEEYVPSLAYTYMQSFKEMMIAPLSGDADAVHTLTNYALEAAIAQIDADRAQVAADREADHVEPVTEEDGSYVDCAGHIYDDRSEG